MTSTGPRQMRIRPPASPTDREIARAEALGRLMAGRQMPIGRCPYDRDARVLRWRWVRAYVGAGGRAGVSRFARAGARVREWLAA